jgi:branched-chain amino acid aminotransferase
MPGIEFVVQYAARRAAAVRRAVWRRRFWTWAWGRLAMTMADRDGLIWLDGAMVPWREAKVHVLTHTLHYGMGVFEGIQAYETAQGTAIFRLAEHIGRLFRSTRILGIPMPYDHATLTEVCRRVVRDNDLKSAYLRPLVFYGAEGMVRTAHLP